MKYHPGHLEVLTAHRTSGAGTVHGRQFEWGGLLLKGNGGVRRFAWYGRTSYLKCNGKSELDCETDTSSRCESRT